MNLQKPYLAQQFALFCWVHMSLLIIVVSSHFIMNNILEVRPFPLCRRPFYAYSSHR